MMVPRLCHCSSQRLLLFQLLLIPFLPANAQEYSIQNVSLFQPDVDFRTDVCDRQRLLNEGAVRIPYALRGLNISIATTDYRNAGVWSHFFALDGPAGRIPTDYPGVYGRLMDEIAQRGQFQWRHQFAAFEPPRLAGTNLTWTDILYWQTEKFDVAVEYWSRTEERLYHGVSFPENWYEGSPVIVQLRQDAETIFSVFSFLEPFTLELWGLIVAAVVFSGLTYWFLERLDNRADANELQDKPVGSIFLASLAFVGHNEYSPNSGAARIMTFSLLFWGVLVFSAYTANLASFLVADKRDPLDIATYEIAQSVGASVCTLQGGPESGYIREHYPHLDVVETASDMESLAKVRRGDCTVASMPISNWQINERIFDINADCRLFNDGRTQFPSLGAFATTVDSGLKCTSLINHVLDYHFIQMKHDGTVKKIWEEYISRVTDHRCIKQLATSAEADAGALGIREMGGIFLFHGSLTMIALAFAFYKYLVRDKRELKDIVNLLTMHKHPRRSTFLKAKSWRTRTSITAKMMEETTKLEQEGLERCDFDGSNPDVFVADDERVENNSLKDGVGRRVRKRQRSVFRVEEHAPSKVDRLQRQHLIENGELEEASLVNSGRSFRMAEPKEFQPEFQPAVPRRILGYSRGGV